MVRSRVLVVSQDPVGERMAGPAIRAFELARALAPHHDVTLAAHDAPGRAGDGFEVAAHHGRPRQLAAGSDVVVAFGRLLRDHPELRRTDAALVVDLYDPAPFEALVHHAHDPLRRRWVAARDARLVLGDQLDAGDLFLCASGRQRDLVTGMLTARGRVNPATFDADPSLGRLVAVVPFGIPATPPERTGARPLRTPDGPFPADALVALWGGGLYDWLDPVTLVEAVARADDRVHAFFLGGAHPSGDVPAMAAHAAAVGRAEELGVAGGRVVFADDWVPYDDRADVLLDADVGVSLHHRHLETRYAFRTRALDYLWASLPIVATEGDVLADLVERRALGRVVPPRDPAAVAAGLEALLDPVVRAGAGEQAAMAAKAFTWDSVAAPLVEFCRMPSRAPDRIPEAARARRRVETRAGIRDGFGALRRRFRTR